MRVLPETVFLFNTGTESHGSSFMMYIGLHPLLLGGPGLVMMSHQLRYHVCDFYIQTLIKRLIEQRVRRGHTCTRRGWKIVVEVHAEQCMLFITNDPANGQRLAVERRLRPLVILAPEAQRRGLLMCGH